MSLFTQLKRCGRLTTCNYAYVGGNPISFTDPHGTNPVAGAIEGAEIGTLIWPGPGTVVGGLVGAGVVWWAGDKFSKVIFANSNPITGEPGSVGTCENKKGNRKQDRKYGNDGYPEYDIDYDHSHDGLGPGHAHNWDRPTDGSPPTHDNRGPGLPFNPLKR